MEEISWKDLDQQPHNTTQKINHPFKVVHAIDKFDLCRL